MMLDFQAAQTVRHVRGAWLQSIDLMQITWSIKGWAHLRSSCSCCNIRLDAACRKGMDLYFKRHDGQAVTCDDFRNAMADANKKDLTSFAAWCVSSHLKPIVVGISSLLCRLAHQWGN